jgi:hypothetical protein
MLESLKESHRFRHGVSSDSRKSCDLATCLAGACPTWNLNKKISNGWPYFPSHRTRTSYEFTVMAVIYDTSQASCDVEISSRMRRRSSLVSSLTDDLNVGPIKFDGQFIKNSNSLHVFYLYSHQEFKCIENGLMWCYFRAMRHASQPLTKSELGNHCLLIN